MYSYFFNLALILKTIKIYTNIITEQTLLNRSMNVVDIPRHRHFSAYLRQNMTKYLFSSFTVYCPKILLFVNTPRIAHRLRSNNT